MTVSYKLIPTSGKLASKKPFKALCAPYATASLQEMGRNIERGTTFSMSDLAGALEALSKELKAQLSCCFCYRHVTSKACKKEVLCLLYDETL